MAENAPINPDDQVLFMACPVKADSDETPLVLLGVSPQAWAYIQDGKTQTFDLSQAGVPVRIILFGGESRESIWQVLNDIAAGAELKVSDERHVDYAINPKKQEPRQ